MSTNENYKLYMQEVLQWIITFKTNEIELNVIEKQKKSPGILNSLEKLKNNLQDHKKLKNDIYFIRGGNRQRIIYKILESDKTVQIIDILEKAKLYKIKIGKNKWPVEWH